jgi:hypothetical protein
LIPTPPSATTLIERRPLHGFTKPELSNLWLARAFNAQDIEAAAALYHPEASIVQIDQVHGGTSIARGADAIRETMVAYIDFKPHMDVVTHHTTIAGDFAMTRSQAHHGLRQRRQTDRGSPPWHGGAPEGRRWHVVLLHRPSCGSGSDLGDPAPARNGLRPSSMAAFNDALGGAGLGSCIR